VHEREPDVADADDERAGGEHEARAEAVGEHPMNTSTTTIAAMRTVIAAAKSVRSHPSPPDRLHQHRERHRRRRVGADRHHPDEERDHARHDSSNGPTTCGGGRREGRGRQRGHGCARMPFIPRQSIGLTNWLDHWITISWSGASFLSPAAAAADS
jgi:hypothetical protein